MCLKINKYILQKLADSAEPVRDVPPLLLELLREQPVIVRQVRLVPDVQPRAHGLRRVRDHGGVRDATVSDPTLL